jgi:hypothetical protein
MAHRDQLRSRYILIAAGGSSDIGRRYGERADRHSEAPVVLHDSVVTANFPASVMCRGGGKSPPSSD